MKKTLKKHGKKVIIDSLVGAIITTFIVYIIIGPYNQDFVRLMEAIAKINVLELIIPLFIVFLLIHLIINFGITVISNGK